jgi:hypothetical protein
LFAEKLIMKRLLTLALMAVGLAATGQWDWTDKGAMFRCLPVVAGGGGNVVTNGLLAFWKLDESSGAAASDSSGNGNTGTLVNGPTWTSGQFGNCLEFASGSNQMMTAGDIGLSSLGAASLSCWFRRDTISSSVGADPNTSGLRFGFLAYSDGTLYGVFANGVYGSCSMNDAAWHHLAVVFDGSLTGFANRCKVYLDGVQQILTPEGVAPATLDAGITSYALGRNIANTLYSDGKIDSVRIYNRALTGDEVATLFINP